MNEHLTPVPRHVLAALVDVEMYGFTDGVRWVESDTGGRSVDMYGMCFFCFANIKRNQTDGSDESDHAKDCPVRLIQELLAAPVSGQAKTRQ